MKLYGSLRELVAAVFRKDTREITLEPNAGTYSGAVNIKLPPVLTGSDVLVSEAGSQPLTNKTIDADLNTVSNIDDGNIKAGAGIDASKIGAGSVDNTEFGYLNGVTSSIQTQLGGKAASGANSDITSLSGLTTALSTGQGGTGVNSTATFPSSGVVVTEAGSATLTNKTIDGDTNTVQDLGLSSLKTVLADANKAILRDAAGAVTSALIANDNVSATAAIADTKLATISTAGKVSNSATTATPLYTTLAPTPNTIVSRDGSGSTSLGGLGVVGNLTTNNFEATGQSLMKFAYINGSTGNGFIEMEGQQVGDIVAPTSGEARLFAGTDGKIYVRKKGSSQAEELGAGGSGEVNLVDNPSDEGNWGEVNATATTNTTAANNPLSGVIDTSIAIASSTSGGYVRYRFSMPSALKQRKLKLEWYQIASSLASGAYKVEVWTNASSDYSGAYTELALSTDSSGTSSIPNLNGKYSTTFDTNGSDYYEIRIVRTAASAATIYIANVVCGPGIQPQGAVVGEWQSYTPVLLTSGDSSDITSNVTKTGRYQRRGSSLKVMATVSFSGTPAGLTGGRWKIGIPSGLTVDTSAFPTISASGNAVGTARARDNGGAQDYTGTAVWFGAGDGSYISVISDQGTTPSWTNTSPFTWSTSDVLTVEFEVPIAEWAGSGTVQLAQNDVEYAYNSDVTNTASITTSGFANGPSGVALSSNWTTNTGFTRRVRFQTPIQIGDKLQLELNYLGRGWVPFEQFYPRLRQSNTFYGVEIQPVSGSSTDVDVVFSAGGYEASNITYGGNGTTWNNLSTSSWRLRKSSAWRVRKQSAGAAVGFGIVSPGTSAGLVSAAGLPGNTTGNAIASGYVGEHNGVQYNSATTSVTGGNTATLSSSTNPPAGTYLVLGKAIMSWGTTSPAIGFYGYAATQGLFGAGIESGTPINTGGNGWYVSLPFVNIQSVNGSQALTIGVTNLSGTTAPTTYAQFKIVRIA